MERNNLNSKFLLNDVLRNINKDIVILRKDFQKLNDSVIILSVKMEETNKNKAEISKLFAKLESITNRIFDLEKSREKLESLISTNINENKLLDQLSDATINQKIIILDGKIIEITKYVPWLKKIIAVLFLLIGVLVYITDSTEKFFVALWDIIKKIFAFF